jgi:hypothetical protein
VGQSNSENELKDNVCRSYAHVAMHKKDTSNGSNDRHKIAQATTAHKILPRPLKLYGAGIVFAMNYLTLFCLHIFFCTILFSFNFF